MSYAIKTEELSKRFGRVQALNGLNLKVPEGAIYALVGPNGAGKTTTLKLLMNVLRPSSGNCEVLGVASEKLRYCDLAVIGYVSETRICRTGLPAAIFFLISGRFTPLGITGWRIKPQHTLPFRPIRKSKP